MKTIVKQIGVFVIAVLILILLLSQLSLEKVLDLLSSIPWWVYVAIALLYSVDWLLRGARWKLFLKANGSDVPLLQAGCISLFGNYANFLVPFRIGDAAWMYAARKIYNIPVAVCITTVIVDRIYDFFMVALLFIISSLFVYQSLFAINPLLIYGIFVVVLPVAGIAGKLFLSKNFMHLFFKSKLKKFEQHYLYIRNAIARTIKKKVVLVAILFTLVVWLLEAMLPYLLFTVLGYNIPFFFVFLAVLLGNLTKILGITPGGVGTYEAAVAGTLILLTPLSVEVAITIAILDHVLKKFYILVVGTITVNTFGLHLLKVPWEKLRAEKLASTK